MKLPKKSVYIFRDKETDEVIAIYTAEFIPKFPTEIKVAVNPVFKIDDDARIIEERVDLAVLKEGGAGD